MLSERKGKFTMLYTCPNGPDSPISVEVSIYERTSAGDICVVHQYASITSDKSDFVDQVIRIIKIIRVFEGATENSIEAMLKLFNSGCPELKG